MANYCDYEIHVRGSKKAALYLYTMMPALDSYCEEKPNVSIDLNSLNEDEIRDEDIGLDYWYLTMRQKSEVLGVEILAHSWSDESEFANYEEFCKEYGIDPEEIPEDAWDEVEEDIYYCFIEPREHVSKFEFDF